MPQIYGMDRELFDQVTRVVRIVLRQERGGVQQPTLRKFGGATLRWALVTGDASPPSDGTLGTSSVGIRLLKTDADDNLIFDGEDEEFMEHRWEDVPFEENQLCIVSKIKNGSGKWVPVCLSCGPLENPPGGTGDSGE